MRHRYLLTFVLLVCVAPVCLGQTTSVTLQATDADTQTWNSGNWTATLYSPPGVPAGPYVIAGSSTPVPNQQQSGTFNASGGASLTVTSSSSISPSGTRWLFVFCPQASPAACSQYPVAVNGTAQTVQPALPAIRLNVSNPIVRVTAYADLEVIGASTGSTYFNLTDLTTHVCTTFVAPNCTAWVVVGTGGGGGGGGGISGLTPGVIPQAATSTSIANTAPQLDNGVTTVNTLTYAGSGGFTLPSDGVHAGSMQVGCLTTVPALAANAGGWIGPNAASCASAPFFQIPAMLPQAGQFMSFGTPSGNVVPVTYGGGSTSVAAQAGDMLRYCVNGETPRQWDPTTSAPNFAGVYAVNQLSGNLGVQGIYGAFTTSIVGGNNNSDLVPTATSQSCKIIGNTAAGVANTIGFSFPENGNSSLIGMQAFYRNNTKIEFNNIASNDRYWFGFATWHNLSGSGNNGTHIVGTTAYATDTPDKSTIGWLIDQGSFSHIQAYVATGGGSHTDVDTGVSPDTTNFHQYDIVPDATGTPMRFYIDGSLVATISTNIPPAANNQESWGEMFLAMDNKNAATAVSATFCSMTTTFK
jgi:hypothetical protein